MILFKCSSAEGFMYLHLFSKVSVYLAAGTIGDKRHPEIQLFCARCIHMTS